MAKVAIDFGTGNTVLARFNETLGRAETLRIPGITTEFRYRLGGAATEQAVHVIPSVIHFAATETLIGDQVVSRGLTEHADTVRWMKRGVATRATRRKKTAQGHKSPAEAGEEFLTRVLNYASDQLSFAQDEFTFTAPTEAFEDFQDWLRRVAEGLGLRRLRMLDEPTACVLGYHGAVRGDDRFLVFDFGCGTLDVATVRIDLTSTDDRKAIQLGQAGCDLGGLNIDTWLADDFAGRHRLSDAERRLLEAVMLRSAEQTKIALSDPAQSDADLQVLNTVGHRPRLLQTTYRRSCAECERGRPGEHPTPHASCLGCLLLKHEFLKQTQGTIRRALENASIKAGVRLDDVTRVLVTGGTSLVPAVQRLLSEQFNGRVDMQSPFDAVARGACRGLVVPLLQHDYVIRTYNRQKQEYEFTPLFKAGTEFPTPRDVRRLWARGTHDGMVKIGVEIYELSQMQRRRLDVAFVDAEGALVDHAHVKTDAAYIFLNRDNPTFITADPPINLARDQQRFICSFWVDGQRRLLISVLDNLTGKTILKDHPVVRL